MTAPDYLSELEREALPGNVADAAKRLLPILRQIDARYGKLPERPDGNDPESLEAIERDCARLAEIVTVIFTHPGLVLDDTTYLGLLNHRRVIESLFAATSFGTSDHALSLLLGADCSGTDFPSTDALAKALLLHSRNSSREIDLEAVWRANRFLALNAFLASLAGRIAIAPREYAWQERILAWLPGKLLEAGRGQVVLDLEADLWLQCSYAAMPAKHQVKRALNKVLRENLLAIGAAEYRDAGARQPRPKARIVCVLEWFTSNHALYRAYSASMRALREHFEVTAVVSEERFADAEALALFDHVLRPAETSAGGKRVAELAAAVLHADPDVIWYPSLGMSQVAIALATLRLAPLQLMSLGHPATSMSPVIDAVIAEADYFNEPSCFCEELIGLPARSMPFSPPRDEVLPPAESGDGSEFRIGIQCSLMKLNPLLLEALRRIRAQASRRIAFHFFVGGAYGVYALHVLRGIRSVLPDAVVRFGLGYADYLRELGRCEMVLAPFPFGNSSGWVDAARLALPGVCMDGAEAHTHMDQALLARLGLPRALVAYSIDGYVKKALRLIEDDAFRGRLRSQLRATDVGKAFFEGDASVFADEMLRLVRTRVWARLGK